MSTSVSNSYSTIREVIAECFYSIAHSIYKWLGGDFANTVLELFYMLYDKRKTVPPLKDPLLLLSATELAKRIRRRQVRIKSVVEAYYNRIDEIQPFINAVVDDRRIEALLEAEIAEQLLQNKTEEELEREYPLLGVPFSVKEAIAVKGLLWTTGSVRRKGIRAEEDAVAVERLKAAGAIPIVNTNTSEVCMWIETFNRLHGRTCNPYDTRRSAGGSSGGECALQTSAGAAFGIANDMAGSIRHPASYDGVYGHKPSNGLVPNKGMFPVLKSGLDYIVCTGPISRYADDLTIAMKIMTGDNAKQLRLDEEVSMKKLKVYYLEELEGRALCFPTVQVVKDAIGKVVSHFRKVCEEPPQKASIPSMKHAFSVLTHELCPRLHGYTTIETHIFGYEKPSKLYKEFLLSVLGLSEYSFPILLTIFHERFFLPSGPSPRNPFEKELKNLKDEFSNILKDNCILIMPCQPDTAQIRYVNALRPHNVVWTGICNTLGLPSTSCPMGLDKDGLPLSVQVVSGHNNDRLNIAVAKEIENIFGGWVCPGSVQCHSQKSL